MTGLIKKQDDLGIYLHVPFCLSKCPYCDFYSLVSTPELWEKYTSKLRGLICCNPFTGRQVSTLYFGGGTPSVLGAGHLKRLVTAVKESFCLQEDAEITLEMNPGDASREFYQQMRASGVNRISMGLQAAQPDALQQLGRRHTREDAAQAVTWARQAGFDNLSLDLMLATPGQTQRQAAESIEFCAGLGVDHISAYLLKVEPNTPFDSKEITSLLPGPDEAAALYLFAVEKLNQLGYQQYEISNFAREGKISRHNTRYWLGQDYLGLGPAAHSLVDGKRFYFPRDLTGFLAARDPMELVISDGEGGTEEEFILLRLRLSSGISWDEYRERFKGSPERLVQKAAPMAKAGLAVLDDTHLALTAQGFLVSNEIITRLLS